MNLPTMRPLILLILSFLLLQSCKSKIDSQPEVFKESKAKDLVYPEQLRDLIKKQNKEKLPFQADSTYVKEFTIENEIDDASIKLLVSNFSESENYDDGYIYEVLRLNNLKSMSQYEDYVNLLDIGQLKDASAHWIGVIEKGDSALVLWAVKYSSYEACPFYSGNEIFASLIHEGIVKKCAKIGEYTSGGDAPYWFENYGLFTIDETFTVIRKMFYASYDDDTLQEKSNSSDVIIFK